ncbi:hypothetical protein QJS10_CPB14g00367 [Acorus calamus]|uniref:Uncharacterized protein n=1 Tax=Acorus calamus TaxID=4465 RepID=A0AAV9DDP0_ACOCL|nr:hypothetical protein QJS10_CPB14g00367 [Acorus calamus]
MPPRRRKLHNFVLPPLRWGNQRLLRCMKKDPSFFNGAGSSTDSPPHPLVAEEVEEEDDDYVEIEEVRERLFSHLERAAEEMKKLPIPGEGGEKKKEEEELPSAKPWNLRIRRTVCKASQSDEAVGSRNPRQNPGSSPPAALPRSRRLRDSAAAGERRLNERPRFTGTLSRGEIEEDFLLFTGKKPQRRPTKRPKNVQNNIISLLPGYWLSEITPDSYRVSDDPETKLVDFMIPI